MISVSKNGVGRATRVELARIILMGSREVNKPQGIAE